MELTNKNIQEFSAKIFSLWHHKWFLLTSGDFDKNEYNTMTVAWGSLGVMWNRPFAQVVVRPTRFTFEFMEKYDTFTLTAFPAEYKSSQEEGRHQGHSHLFQAARDAGRRGSADRTGVDDTHAADRESYF